MSQRPHERTRFFFQGVPANQPEVPRTNVVGFGKRTADLLDVAHANALKLTQLLAAAHKIAIELLKIVMTLCAIALTVVITHSATIIEKASSETIARRLQSDVPCAEWLIIVIFSAAICTFLLHKVPKFLTDWREKGRAERHE